MFRRCRRLDGGDFSLEKIKRDVETAKLNHCNHPQLVVSGTMVRVSLDGMKMKDNPFLWRPMIESTCYSRIPEESEFICRPLDTPLFLYEVSGLDLAGFKNFKKMMKKKTYIQY